MKQIVLTFCLLMFFRSGLSQDFALDGLLGVSTGINDFSYISEKNSKFHQIPTVGILWGLRATLSSKRRLYYEFSILNFGNSTGVEVRDGSRVSSMIKGNADYSYSIGLGYRRETTQLNFMFVSLGFGYENIKKRYVNLSRIGQLEFYKTMIEEKLNPFVYLSTGYCYNRNRHLFKIQMIGRIGWHYAKQEWFKAYEISDTPISAILKNKGDLVSFSVSYGYQIIKNRS